MLQIQIEAGPALPEGMAKEGVIDIVSCKRGEG